MPDELTHIYQANRNHGALEYLMNGADCYSEWVTTVAFYKAVHVVEAMLFHQYGINSHDHRKRLGTLQSRNKELYKQFRPLHQASMVARYLCSANGHHTQYAKFGDYLSAESVVQEMVHRRLARVEQIALNNLSECARQTLVKVFVPTSGG